MKLTKTCSKCGVRRLRSEFYPRKIAKDGLRSSCKPCGRELCRPKKKTHTARILGMKKPFTTKHVMMRLRISRNSAKRAINKLLKAGLIASNKDIVGNFKPVTYRRKQPWITVLSMF